MAGPEAIYARLAAGAPGRIREEAESAHRTADDVDEARDSIAHGVQVPGFAGLSALGYQARGQKIFVEAGGASWGVHRIGDFLDAAAQTYDQTMGYADQLMYLWHRRDPSLPDVLLRFVVQSGLSRVEQLWDQWLRDAAVALDQDGGAGFGAWFERGQAKDYWFMVRTDARRGFRIPDSLLNGDDGGWTQQGLAYDARNDLFVVSSYRDHDNDVSDGEDDPDDSQVTLIDSRTGREITTTQLVGPDGGAAPSHSGGVAIQGNALYVVGGGHVYRYDLDAVRDARPGEPVPAEGVAEVPGSSYVTVAEGRIWLGDHGGERLYSFTPADIRRLEEGGSTVDVVGHYSAPPGANGVIVQPGGDFLFAENNGRDVGSQLLAYPRSGEGEGTPVSPFGNLVEEIEYGPDGTIVGITESGADAYSWRDRDDDGGKDSTSAGKEQDLWAQTHAFVLPEGAASGEVEIDYETVAEARRNLLTATDRLEAAVGSIARGGVVARFFGEVDGAAVFARAVNGYYDDCAAHLRQGVSATQDTSDGLWDISEGFEGTDGDVSSYFRWLGSGPTGPPTGSSR